MSSQIKYVEVVNRALHTLMDHDESIILIGQGVTSPWYVGGTCNGLLEKFGPKRVIDTPVSECGTAALACGAAIAGLRPILMFPRMDFMLYAMDPIINQMAKWSYMTGGRLHVPCVIWAIINRFGSQGAQHSQDFAWIFERIPGLKVVRPYTARMAMDLLCDAVYDDNPVVFVDDRALYNTTEEVTFPMEHTFTVDNCDFNRSYPAMPVPAGPTMEEEFYEHLFKSAVH